MEARGRMHDLRGWMEFVLKERIDMTMTSNEIRLETLPLVARVPIFRRNESYRDINTRIFLSLGLAPGPDTPSRGHFCVSGLSMYCWGSCLRPPTLLINQNKKQIVEGLNTVEDEQEHLLPWL